MGSGFCPITPQPWVSRSRILSLRLVCGIRGWTLISKLIPGSNVINSPAVLSDIPLSPHTGDLPLLHPPPPHPHHHSLPSAELPAPLEQVLQCPGALLSLFQSVSGPKFSPFTGAEVCGGGRGCIWSGSCGKPVRARRAECHTLFCHWCPRLVMWPFGGLCFLI